MCWCLHFYITIFVAVSMLLLTQGMDIPSSASAVAATLGNVGPGFGPSWTDYNLCQFDYFDQVVAVCLHVAGQAGNLPYHSFAAA